MEVVIDVQRARKQLSRLVAMAQRGGSVTISRRGKPVARLVGVKRRAGFGLMKDQSPAVAVGGFAPVSDSEAAEWGL